MHHKLRLRVLGWCAALVSARPWWVLFIAAAVAVLAVMSTTTGLWIGSHALVRPLRFESDRNKMLSEKLDWNRRYLRWRYAFAGLDDLIIVIDVHGRNGRLDAADLERARGLADQLGARLLKETDLVRNVVWRYDENRISPRLLRLLRLPKDEKEDNKFQQRIDKIQRSGIMLESTTPQQLLVRMTGLLIQQRQSADLNAAAESLGELRRWINALAGGIETAPNDPLDFEALLGTEWHYGGTDNERLLFLLITPRLDRASMKETQALIAATRRIMEDIRAGNPEVSMGLTGVQVAEADETRAAMRDSTVASTIALVLIFALLVLAFHSWRVPLLAIVALLIGIAWSFGFVAVVIQHLQVLSVVFTAILLGLGIAFGIHVATGYELVRHQFADTSEGFAAAMGRTLRDVGPGLITAALTTAAAFATVGFSKFKGLAEMGLIAAAGVLLCFLSMLTVFPALLRIYKKRHHHLVPMADRRLHLFSERLVLPFSNRPRATLIGVLLLTALASVGMSRVRFDFNLLNLHPRGAESIIWQEKIINDGGKPLWYAVSLVDDLEEARKLASKFHRLESVGELGGVGRLMPPDESRKLSIVVDARRRLEPALRKALTDEVDDRVVGDEPDLLTQVAMFRSMLSLLGGNAPESIRPELDRLGASLDQVVQAATALSPAHRRQRVDRLVSSYRRWRRDQAQRIDVALDGAPLQIEDLPAPSRDRSVANGLYAIEIYPNLDNVTNPLDRDFLATFIAELRGIDEDVTGVSVQIYNSGVLIESSFLLAGAAALLVVFIIVMLDFWRVGDALLALVPVVIGFIWMFGVMWLIGVDVNAANIMVLPLLFGIGVDSGVHILHRYRQDQVSRPLGLTAGTGKGVTITSLTTMIGFGSMISASHRGIQSLGIVVTIGIGLTLVACWVVMPAWLELRQRRREAQSR